MREKRPRDVWRLDMRVLYFWSVCECVFVMSVYKRYLPVILLPTPLPTSLLSMRFVGTIMFFFLPWKKLFSISHSI